MNGNFTNKIILKQLFASSSVIMVNMLELNTEKEGCMSYTAPEDSARRRAVYDMHLDFRGI